MYGDNNPAQPMNYGMPMQGVNNMMGQTPSPQAQPMTAQPAPAFDPMGNMPDPLAMQAQQTQNEMMQLGQSPQPDPFQATPAPSPQPAQSFGDSYFASQPASTQQDQAQSEPQVQVSTQDLPQSAPQQDAVSTNSGAPDQTDNEQAEVTDETSAEASTTEEPKADDAQAYFDDYDSPEPDSVPGDSASQPASEQTSPAAPMQPDDLVGMKQQALEQLSPLVEKLDQTPSEKFRTTMMMIQATDNKSLISKAYEAAQAIEDDKERAQALLDIVNEINYFTSQTAQ